MSTSNQKAAEVIKLYFETKSPVTVIHMIQKKYPEDDRLKKLQVHQLVHRFQQTRSVEDNQHSNSGNFKKSIDVVLMEILIGEFHYNFFANKPNDFNVQ